MRILQTPAASVESSAAAVNGLLAKLPPDQFQIVVALRRLIRKTTSGTEETVLWKSLSYHRPGLGGRIAGAVCLITPKADCVHLGFIRGAVLRDPHRLLRGTGKAKRFVPLRRIQEVHRAELQALIWAAAGHNPRTQNNSCETRLPRQPSFCRRC